MEMSEQKDGIAEVARETLEKLLGLMGVSTSVVLVSELAAEGEEGALPGLIFDIEGDDLGILIGRRGQTLACLQFMVRLIVAHRTKVWRPIVIDIGDYNRRRQEALQALAFRMAEQVKERGVPFALEPMPAADRRIIHLSLAENPDVTTQSSGEREERKVVILPQEPLD
ncbi:MAG: RNA-binding protein [Dehalococcoidales bacterium]|jgi:spoIIIJ-associated protein|nr:RNA-binding protein [Dehalococcoidales bacterium]|tara:strand:+ start:956 stop:1462 length:507 start_codon:yes stop_codon:yes gene_type:complete